MYTILAFLLFVGCLVFFIIQGENPNSDMAKRLGLINKSNFLGKSTFTGMIDGVPVKAIETLRHNSHSARISHSVTVTIPCPLPQDLQIYREDFASGFGKMIGLQDIVVGHPQLDALVIIKGKNPAEVMQFFSRPSIADATFSLFDRYNQITLANKTLSIQLNTTMSAITEQMIVSIVDYVNVLSGKREHKTYDNSLIEAGLSDMSFEDNAQFVQQEIARRKAAGSPQNQAEHDNSW